ncbi:MAG TPA: AraC family transcriptional regulator [Ramlibacter sp.]|nr:AraC family transcriptional regulator [Ramlibacter sp.]
MTPGAEVWYPGDEQRFEWKGAGPRDFLFVDMERAQEVLGGPAQRQPLRMREGRRRLSPVADFILQAMERDLQEGSPAGPLVGDSLIVALLAHLHAGVPQASRGRSSLPGHVAKTVIAYIDERLTEPLTLAELAAVAQMSVRHFCRAFAGSVGCTPHQYLLRQRVERAKALIAAGQLPLAQIAHHVGFADQSQLTRTFRRFTGTTPSVHRAGL